MGAKAHRRLLEVDRGAVSDDAYDASNGELVAPGLAAVAQIGNTYTASLYVCLAAMLEADGRALAGRRIGLFSYGSGCCAEFFTGLVPAGAATLGPTGVRDVLARRTLVDVPAYEQLLHASEQGGAPPADFTGDFVFRGVCDDRRRYERAREALAA
jgi:hydroxymethylglutaryl-CoA synthase